MACSKCGAKKKAGTSTAVNGQAVAAEKPIAQPKASPNAAILGAEYVFKRYIGPAQEVRSVFPNMSYGRRVAGNVLRVAVQDIEANPEWWEDIE